MTSRAGRAPSDGPRKRYASCRIAEDIQTGMRRRLTLLRQSRNLQYSQVRCLSPSTISTYERVDISTLTLGNAQALATELGMSMAEFFAYLCGNRDELAVREATIHTEAIEIHMRELPPELRDVAVDLVRTLAVHHARTTNGERIAMTLQQPTARARLQREYAKVKSTYE